MSRDDTDDRFDLPPRQDPGPRLTENERRDLFLAIESLAKMQKNVAKALHLDETGVHRDNVRNHIFDVRAEMRVLSLMVIPIVDEFNRTDS